MVYGGMYRGTGVLSKEFVTMCITEHTPVGQWPYGFLWHLNTKDQRHLDRVDGFLVLGQGEQALAALPEKNHVLCWVSSTWVNELGYRLAMKEIDEKFVKRLAE